MPTTPTRSRRKTEDLEVDRPDAPTGNVADDAPAAPPEATGARADAVLTDAEVNAAIERARQEKLHGQDAQAAAEEHNALIRAVLDPRDHMRDCPYVEEGGRVEAYRDTIPADPRKQLPAYPCIVAACLECGGRAVLSDRPVGAYQPLTTPEAQALNADLPGL